MCITLRPAKLRQTLIYAGEAHHPDTQDYIHVLAYQNQAKNKGKGPNAMVLPIPSAEPLGKANTIDLTGYKDLLEEMAETVKGDSLTLSMSEPNRRSFKVFETGSYTVAVAQNAWAVTEALAALPDNRRPQFNQDVFAAFARWYPEWPLAICCWDGEIKPEPLLWWYKPLNPEALFLPALDAHNGKAPDLNKDVQRDHVLMVGSKIHPFGLSTYVDDMGPAAPYFSDRIWGREVEGADFNRDFELSVPDLREIPASQSADFRSRLDPKVWDLTFEHRHPGRA